MSTRPTVINTGSVINCLTSDSIVPHNALVTENLQCSVCPENTNDPHVAVPECRHSFCADCIKECIGLFGNERPAQVTSKPDLRQEKKIDNVSTYDMLWMSYVLLNSKEALTILLNEGIITGANIA